MAVLTTENAGMIELRKRMLKYVRVNVKSYCTDEFWQTIFTIIINIHSDDPLQWLEDHAYNYANGWHEYAAKRGHRCS